MLPGFDDAIKAFSIVLSQRIMPDDGRQRGYAFATVYVLAWAAMTLTRESNVAVAMSITFPLEVTKDRLSGVLCDLKAIDTEEARAVADLLDKIITRWSETSRLTCALIPEAVRDYLKSHGAA